MTKETFWNFFGLLLLSGYNIRSSDRDYRSKSPDLACTVFINTMSRNKFQQIKSYLHVADNHSRGQSKMATITLLYDILITKLIQFGVLHQELFIDESILPYFVRHSCKKFIREKPINFGYKIWTICSSSVMPLRRKNRCC